MSAGHSGEYVLFLFQAGYESETQTTLKDNFLPRSVILLTVHIAAVKGSTGHSWTLQMK